MMAATTMDKVYGKSWWSGSQRKSELGKWQFRKKKGARRAQAVSTPSKLSVCTAGTRNCMSVPSDHFKPSIWDIYATVSKA